MGRWLIARSIGWIDESGGMGQACEVSEPMTDGGAQGLRSRGERALTGNGQGGPLTWVRRGTGMDSSQPLIPTAQSSTRQLVSLTTSNNFRHMDCSRIAARVWSRLQGRGELVLAARQLGHGIHTPPSSLGNPARSPVLSPTQCHRPDYH